MDLLTMPPFERSSPVAGSAIASAVAFVGIRGIVGVTVPAAISLPGFPAAPDVFAVSHRFEMVGVDAPGMAADVVKLKSPRRKLTPCEAVGEAMSAERPTFPVFDVPDAELSIAVPIEGTEPLPATGPSLDTLPKSPLGGFVEHDWILS